MDKPPAVDRAFLLLARQVEAYADASEPLHGAPITPGSLAARQIEEAPDLPVLDTWTAPHLLLVVSEDHLRLLDKLGEIGTASTAGLVVELVKLGGSALG